MADNATNLTPKQAAAIRALLSEPSVPEAAKAAGVVTATVYKWLADETFRHALNRAEGAAIDHASRRLVVLVDDALNVIQTAMNDEDAHIATRLSAARTVLENMLRLRELRTIEERLSRLEAMSNAESNQPPDEA